MIEDTQKWEDFFDMNCDEDGSMITWAARLKTGIPTRTINYHLSKLAKKGILIKTVYPGCCTKFHRPG